MAEAVVYDHSPLSDFLAEVDDGEGEIRQEGVLDNEVGKRYEGLWEWGRENNEDDPGHVDVTNGGDRSRDRDGDGDAENQKEDPDRYHEGGDANSTLALRHRWRRRRRLRRYIGARVALWDFCRALDDPVIRPPILLFTSYFLNSHLPSDRLSTSFFRLQPIATNSSNAANFNRHGNDYVISRRFLLPQLCSRRRPHCASIRRVENVVLARWTVAPLLYSCLDFPSPALSVQFRDVYTMTHRHRCHLIFDQYAVQLNHYILRREKLR